MNSILEKVTSLESLLENSRPFRNHEEIFNRVADLRVSLTNMISPTEEIIEEPTVEVVEEVVVEEPTVETVTEEPVVEEPTVEVVAPKTTRKK